MQDMQDMQDIEDEKPFNRLTPAEAERLHLLIEEASEVIQAATKVLRHGYDSGNPYGVGPDNRGQLERELGDLAFTVRLMMARKDVREKAVDNYALFKRVRVSKYLHHNTAEGVK